MRWPLKTTNPDPDWLAQNVSPVLHSSASQHWILNQAAVWRQPAKRGPKAPQWQFTVNISELTLVAAWAATRLAGKMMIFIIFDEKSSNFDDFFITKFQNFQFWNFGHFEFLKFKMAKKWGRNLLVPLLFSKIWKWKFSNFENFSKFWSKIWSKVWSKMIKIDQNLIKFLIILALKWPYWPFLGSKRPKMPRNSIFRLLASSQFFTSEKLTRRKENHRVFLAGLGFGLKWPFFGANPRPVRKIFQIFLTRLGFWGFYQLLIKLGSLWASLGAPGPATPARRRPSGGAQPLRGCWLAGRFQPKNGPKWKILDHFWGPKIENFGQKVSKFSILKFLGLSELSELRRPKTGEKPGSEAS